MVSGDEFVQRHLFGLTINSDGKRLRFAVELFVVRFIGCSSTTESSANSASSCYIQRIRRSLLFLRRIFFGLLFGLR